MIRTFLQQAAGGRTVYITDVREAFQAQGRRPFHLHVTLYDRSVRGFDLLLPEAAGKDEEAFVADYVHAAIYNLLSSLGGVRIDIYLDKTDPAALALAEELDGVFQLDRPKAARTGYGKCLNVNERILAALFHGAERFAFHIHDISEEPAVQPPKRIGGQAVFDQLPAMTTNRMLLGMDIGGTDVKLAVSVDGALALCKEFDWSPASCTRAEEITGPLLLLTRLLRAAGSLYRAGRAGEIDQTALDRRAAPEEMERAAASMERAAASMERAAASMERAAASMERAAGDDLCAFDAIGLSFPDVVVQNRIVGGETHKTYGLRSNPDLDYEAQFAEITGLDRALAAYVAEGGAVMSTNDGHMAAFAAAVEQGAGGGDVSRGFFAHSLGTDLGTGWVRPDGSIPEIPLEVYNLIIDLGSRPQKTFQPGDVRSINNVNTGLSGTLPRYTSQSGIFRLAAQWLPERDPELMRKALDKGLFRWEGEALIVPDQPEDMRKPCLEFFMERAAEGHPVCEEMFRTVGEYLAVVWRETEYILQPETKERTLFGRLVKLPACFALMCEGAGRREPALVQHAADGGLANTPLMRQLDAHSDYTVAQFAQAVGAIYYGCLGLRGGTATE